MGRPIKKSWFGTGAGSQINFTANLGAGDVTCYAVAQKGTRKYKLTTDNITFLDCVLVNKDSGLSVGECRVAVTPFGAVSPQNASKITQHRVTTFGVDAGSVTAVAISNGGTGYTVGDVLTVAGGSGTGLILTVATEAAGVITGVTITVDGSGYAGTDTGLTVTGGTGGDDAVFDISSVSAGEAASSYSWSGSAAAAAGEADLDLV